MPAPTGPSTRAHRRTRALPRPAFNADPPKNQRLATTSSRTISGCYLLKDHRLTSICHPSGARMAENVHQLRPKPADSEKITINLGYVDLGHIDLMVQEGFYSNRTDFIRTAIRNQLERYADVVKQSTVRKRLDLGLRHYSRQDLEAARAAGEMLHIQVLGLASIAADVTPELARAAIASVVVLGALHASAAVKTTLADRMR